MTVFFEVKYRSTHTHGSAIETLTDRKKHRVLFAAKWYCIQQGLCIDAIRIDFIAIQKISTGYRLTHIKNLEINA